MNTVKSSRYLISLMFLLLIVGSVFSSSIDINRLQQETVYFDESITNQVFDRGDSCQTIKLPKESVRKIWNDIIVNGFTIDNVESNIDPNLNREELIQNELLVTDPNAVAGDLAVKKEMPNQIINPLETSALLAQSCEGSFQYGLDLDTTLRLGRCEDPDSGCYTRGFGLFRQNGMTGFFPEMFSVGKDLLDAAGLNKAKELAGEVITGQKTDYNIELGPFSDASVAELNHYKDLLENKDVNEMNFQTLKLVTDKAVSNNIETSSFSTSMATTGNSEHTFINTYSLFDKMFNQYYSTDMVLSSGRVLLGAVTAKIMKVPSIKAGYEGMLKKVFKKKGAMYTFFENPANILLDTKRTLAKANVAGKEYRAAAKTLKEITENGSFAFNIKSKEQVTRMIQENGLDAKWDTYKKALEKGKSEIQKVVINDPDFLGKMTSKQKKVFFDLVSQEQAISSLAKNKASDILKNDTITSINQRINEWRRNGDTLDVIYGKLTPDEIALHKDSMLAYQDIVKSIDNQSINLGKATSATDAFTNRTIRIDPSDVSASYKGTNLDDVIASRYVTPTGSSTINKSTFTFMDDEVFGFDAKTGGIIKELEFTDITGHSFKKKVLVPSVSIPQRTGGSSLLNTTDEITNFLTSDPNNMISISVKGTPINITSANLGNYQSEIAAAVAGGGVAQYKLTNTSIEKILSNPSTTLNKYCLDTIDLMDPYLNGVNKALSVDYAGAVDMTYTALQNKGFVDYASTSFVDYKMKQFVNVNNLTGFIANSTKAFAYNFLYWQVKRGASDIGFLDALGLDNVSIYRLPESYASINITHQMSPTIYDDAYIDFFANDGSDQGDLFMKFLNSAVFIFPKIAKIGTETLSETSPAIASLDRTIDNYIKGKLKKDIVDNIVLFTDTINTGCKTNCLINIAPEYIEKETKQKSLEGLSDDLYSNYTKQIDPGNIKTAQEIQENKTQERLANLDSTIKMIELEYQKEGYSSEEIQKIVDEYKTDMLKQIQESQERINYETTSTIDTKEKINLNFYVPSGFKTSNYILENTTKENYEEKGQTLITFSHHTDYSGTNEGEKSEEEINLLRSQQERNTCAQKVEDLKFAGIPIGGVFPKDYRAAILISGVDHLAYWTLPVPTNPIIAPAILVSLPLQMVIVPQLNGCVDDQEGLYTHIYMNPLEYLEKDKDPKNKVADVVDQGLDTIEQSLTNITKGTDFEKTVQSGTTEAKNFVEKNLRDHSIVQSNFSTSVGTNATLDGRLFFFELGPSTRCRANNLNDKGVEILIDKNKKEALEIDKEKGEMNLVDKDGNVNKIIDSESSDFVRLVATNLGIPAKIVPLMLTYISVPDDKESLLFEMDVYGNFFVEDSTFMDCLKNGYFEQTGNEISAGQNNLVEYLGAVKSVNVISTISQYDVYPQNTKISAQGTPRQVAEGNVAKLSIYGDRTSKLFPIEGVENKTVNLGKNISVQFERGQLVYSGEKDAYIMWVEYTSITNGEDIKEINTKLEGTAAENGCDDEEIAISFNAVPKNDDPESVGYNNVKKLNNALEKVGPFQMFDTPTKTFIFYIGDPPECEQRLKIIDKETGEVYDMKVTNVKETPEGIQVQTEDGVTHNFDIDAENGVPKLKYNDDVETLLSAQGKNGAFWYDPTTGNWYTENGMMIPYNQAFKDGMLFSTGADGKVTGTPGQNVFNIGADGSGKSASGFNIPLSPTSTISLIFYILFFMCCFYVSYFITTKKR